MANENKIEQAETWFEMTAEKVAELEANEGIFLRDLEAAGLQCLTKDGAVTGVITNASTPDHLPWGLLEIVSHYCPGGSYIGFNSTWGQVRYVLSGGEVEEVFFESD